MGTKDPYSLPVKEIRVIGNDREEKLKGIAVKHRCRRRVLIKTALKEIEALFKRDARMSRNGTSFQRR